jgi:ABC-2 type transport system permease protein
MSDLWTMLWKETKDLLFQGGWAAFIRPGIVIAVMGIVLPLQMRSDWFTFSPIEVTLVIFISFFFILNFIGDAIAGEHERHTLETLLASRISDRSILLGKVIVTVGYAWAMVIISLLLGALVLNMTNGTGAWAFYTPVGLLFYLLALSLLTSLLVASGGVLVSLHSATVRQAQQTLILCTLVFGVALGLGLNAAGASLFLALSNNQILLLILAVLAILDAILLGIALASFKRARLILS